MRPDAILMCLCFSVSPDFQRTFHRHGVFREGHTSSLDGDERGVAAFRAIEAISFDRIYLRCNGRGSGTGNARCLTVSSASADFPHPHR